MPTIARTTSPYPPLNVQVHTPRLSLLGATDGLLEQLVPVVRKGVVTEPPWPFDDPMSLYQDSPNREWAWLRGIWAGRAKVSDSFWRLYFVVVVEGDPVGMQDLVGNNFSTYGTVSTFSWLSPETRGLGLGKEVARRPRVHPHHRRAALDQLPGLDPELENLARRLGLHLDHGVRLDRPRGLGRDHDIAARHGDGLVGRRGLLLLAGAEQNGDRHDVLHPEHSEGS